MYKLKLYIREVTGLNVEELRCPVEAFERLPMFIRERYTFLCGTFFEHKIVFVEPEFSNEVTPSRLQKDIPKIESTFTLPVIMVFKEMSYYLKEQLIKDRISFIQPGKQLFIPFMFMDLKEQQKIRKTRTEYFSPSTQCVFIYHLAVSSLEGLNFLEIADLFDYTPRTISRCADEMENARICKITGSKSKYMEFGKSKRDLWMNALEYLVSPVKESKWLVNEPDDMSSIRLAGVPALSKYSNIEHGKLKTYAINNKKYRTLKTSGDLVDTMYNESDVELQVWNYNPTLLSQKLTVDPFSLYLSLINDQDERLIMELENMLEEVLN